MSLYNKLKQPFPYNSATLNHLGVAAFFAIFIFVFLLVFKPFDLGKHDNAKLWTIALGYGAVSFFCIFFFNALFPRLFPGFFNERDWTTGRQIFLMLLVIFLVGLGNFFISPILINTPLNLFYVFWFQGITIAIAVLPVSIFFLIKQNRLLRKFSMEASQIESKLIEKRKEEEKKESSEALIPGFKLRLQGDNQGELVDLYADDLYVISAASNYIKLFHLQKEKLVYSILRSTLKRTEETLVHHPNFFKCHRAFIINLDKVIHVEGNAQGYKLKVEGYEDLVPVSRSLNNEFSDKLLSFRKPVVGNSN